MSQVQFVVREACSSDLSHLRRALVLALHWRSEPPPDFDQALQASGHAWLLDGWGRDGDSAVVAESSDGVLGAAWCRLWTEAKHSYGFVAPEIPELGIGVHHRWRGRGVGGALLDALCSGLAEAGVASVSLSVEVDNPSRRLYLRSGFVDHGRVGGAFTMIRGLEFDRAS